MDKGFTHYLVPAEDFEKLVAAFVDVSKAGHEKRRKALVKAMRSAYMKVRVGSNEDLSLIHI